MASQSSEPRILAVDELDRPLGAVGKAIAHAGEGQLHRAFTLVRANDRGDLLWAQRSPDKPLWPGAWDATVASHPEAVGQGQGAEAFEVAGVRRVREELGLDPGIPLDVRDAGRFRGDL